MTVVRGSHSAGTHFWSGEHTALARVSVGLATAAASAVVAAGALFGSAIAIGGTTATEDNWVGMTTVALILVGAVTSLVAFVLAITVRIKHEHWPLLWLPMSVFPALVAFLALGEAFWWE